MKYIVKKIQQAGLLAILFLMAVPVDAQIAQGYEVATWHQFRTSAVSYTFDDNTANQLSVALPLFNQYDFKVTLFVITSRISNWSGYITAANNGHEVTSHTVNHPNLTTLTVENQDAELKNSQIAIQSNIKISDCSTIAYPNCAVGDISSVQKYYIAGRVCNGAIIPSTPSDFYRISSIGTGTVSSVQTAQQFNDKVNQAKSSKGWCMFLTHAIDAESGYSPTQSTELATHLAYVNANSSDFWVATFENVVKYIKERNAMSISEIPAGTDSYLVTATDNLLDSVYNVPVTIKRLLPSNWTSAKVFVNNEPISSSISTVGTNKYIVFDIVPDKDEVMLVKSSETEIPSVNNNRCFRIEPNPFSNETKVSALGAFKYSVYDLDGRLTEEGNGLTQKNIGVNLTSGVYILKLNSEDHILNTKIIKI